MPSTVLRALLLYAALLTPALGAEVGWHRRADDLTTFSELYDEGPPLAAGAGVTAHPFPWSSTAVHGEVGLRFDQATGIVRRSASLLDTLLTAPPAYLTIDDYLARLDERGRHKSFVRAAPPVSPPVQC